MCCAICSIRGSFVSVIRYSMDVVEGERRKKVAVVAAALLVICGILSIVLSAVSVGVVDNLPVFSKSTINYGVQGSQLFQTGEVKAVERPVQLALYNLTDCEVNAEFSIRKSQKTLYVCTKDKVFYVVLSERLLRTGQENRLYFTVVEWRRFMHEVLDVMIYIVTNVKC